MDVLKHDLPADALGRARPEAGLSG